MLAINKYLFFLFFFVAFSGNNILEAQASQPVYSKDIEEKISRIEKGLGGWVQVQDSANNQTLKDRMKFYKVYGLSVAVVHNYTIEWARGYGWADSADHRPVTVNTLFQAASISKSVNAMGVVKLAEQKKIDLYQDINHYLKTWKFPEDSFTRNKKINVANLLSHTAGLSIHGFPGYNRKDTLPTVNDVLDGKHPANTKAVRSEFEPGLSFQYSGGGITITQKIIMDVTGQPYDVYMKKAVLDPVGMKSSFYTQPPPSDKINELATAYYADGKPVDGKFHVYPEEAPAGLWTNPTDLGHFIIEVQLSLQGKSNKVLSANMVKTMLTPYANKSVALGFFIDSIGGQKYFQHGGSNEGFRSHYYGSFENGNGVAIMVNSDNGNIMEEVINSIAAEYQWKDFYKPVIKKTAQVPGNILDTYTGAYKLGEDTLYVTRQGDQLFVAQNSERPLKMYFTSDRDCFIYEVRADLSFLKNSEGKVDIFFIKQPGGEHKAIKIQ